jgi:hypothetical protein
MGVRQAVAFARRMWNLELDADTRSDLLGTALSRICEISAAPARDRDGYMVTAARYAAQSWIRQYVIGPERFGASLICALRHTHRREEVSHDLG